MPLIGYARVSTEDQTTLPQSQALKSAGCADIHEEQASGGNRARPVLARVLERIGKGDTLVVVRIDRLARSLSHLLEVIERLEAKGAFFRSLTDPIDTSSPQGKFTLPGWPAQKPKAGLAAIRACAPAIPRRCARCGWRDTTAIWNGYMKPHWTGCRTCAACGPTCLGKTCFASSTPPCPVNANGRKAASCAP